jgi:hypothetical protein
MLLSAHSRHFALRVFLLILSFVLNSRLLAAQQQEPGAQEPPIDNTDPKPAGRSPYPVIDPEENDQGQDLQADFNPLTGLEAGTLGTPNLRHSYWLAGVQFGSSIQSQPINGSGSSGWFSDNYFLGNFSLLKASSRSEFAVNYSGGGFVSTNSGSQASGTSEGAAAQQLALQETIRTQRWLIQAVDQFSYLPQSSFGFGIGTNLGVPGVGGIGNSLGSTIPGIGGIATPNQGIYATVGPIYSNTGILQATYTISRRSSVTFAGSYGILRFVDPGNVDQDSILGTIGYNYKLTSKDTIGVVYLFSAYHFPGEPQAFGNHAVALAYGRKITGRLVLQLTGGPQVSTYRIPIGTSSQEVGFYATGNLTYAMGRKGSISTIYTHGLSGGSGVFSGSNSDQVTFTASRNLSRAWTGNVNLGYSHNSALDSTAQTSASSYDSWFVGAGVNRSIGRNVYFGIAYAAYISKSGTSAGGASNTTYTTNAINISLQWHTRPYVLE